MAIVSQSSPADVMRIVRDYWKEHVNSASADDTGPDAHVVRAFQDTLARMRDHRIPVGDAVIEAVSATPEWKIAHRTLVTDIFTSITGRQPGDDDLRNLLSFKNTDDIARRVVELEDGRIESTSSSSREVGHDGGVEGGGVDYAVVDETWVCEFANAFGRDPFVHEYVLVRPMQGDLCVLAAKHKQSFGMLRAIHAQYLDDKLTEQQFVKTYVPRVYHTDTLPDMVRMDALHRPEYRKAMEARIASLHLVICGRELSDAESSYLFEKDVFERELPLDTDELSDVVAEFVKRGEEIRERIAKLVDVYLRRQPDADEVDEWVFPFRTQDGAENRFRTEIVGSHEFHAVICDIIRTQDSDIRTREVYRKLDKVLAKVDLTNVESRYDVDEALMQDSS